MKNIEINKNNAFAVLGRALSELQDGKTYTVEIKEKKERRSKDANAYMWVLLDKLAKVTGIPKIEIYRDLVKNIGGNCDTVCVQEKAVEAIIKGWEHNGLGWVCDTFQSKIEGCQNIILYYGSSTYDREQMARLIDLVVAECKIQNIETKTPEEIENLKSLWGEKN